MERCVVNDEAQMVILRRIEAKVDGIPLIHRKLEVLDQGMRSLSESKKQAERVREVGPDLLEALERIAYSADAGRQYNPGTEQTMRELFLIIRDIARTAIAKTGGGS
jgi:hypothetical protein